MLTADARFEELDDADRERLAALLPGADGHDERACVDALVAALPSLPADLPWFGPGAPERWLDWACPPGRVLVVGAYAGADLSTAVALVRSPAGFARVVGPARLRGELGLVTGDWRSNARKLVRAIESRIGPVGLGLFAPEHTLRWLLGRGEPGAWAAAVATGEVLVHPVAVALALPLGLDAGRAAWVLARDLASALGILGKSR